MAAVSKFVTSHGGSVLVWDGLLITAPCVVPLMTNVTAVPFGTGFPFESVTVAARTVVRVLLPLSPDCPAATNASDRLDGTPGPGVGVVVGPVAVGAPGVEVGVGVTPVGVGPLGVGVPAPGDATVQLPVSKTHVSLQSSVPAEKPSVAQL